MKIILISKVANVGDIGDIVDVKNGFARNFLIPQKKAIYYSNANYKVFEEKKKQFEVENQENLQDSNKIKEKISGKDILIIENASDDGRLYGSVSTNTIADQISELLGKAKSISRSNIILEKPIKDIGLYNIIIDLHSDVNFPLRVIVSRNKSEAKTLIEDAKSGNKKKDKEDKEDAELTADQKVDDKKEDSPSKTQKVTSDNN